MKKNNKAIAATTIVNTTIFRLTSYRNADKRGNVHVNPDGIISSLTDPFAQRESDMEWRS